MNQKRDKKACLKFINGRPFVYSWAFRPKHIRTKRKNQRFQWEYIGPLHSKHTEKFLKSLPMEKQNELYRQFLEKQAYYEQINKTILLLLKNEPYKSEKEAILKINNRIDRDKKLSLLNKKLRKEAIEFTNNKN